MGDSEYIKTTKTIDCNNRITLDASVLEALNASRGDVVEVLIKIMKKRKA